MDWTVILFHINFSFYLFEQVIVIFEKTRHLDSWMSIDFSGNWEMLDCYDVPVEKQRCELKRQATFLSGIVLKSFGMQCYSVMRLMAVVL